MGAGAQSTVTADLVSFSRAKGVYPGLNLDGAVVHSNVGWNNAYYGGSNVTPSDILDSRKLQVGEVRRLAERGHARHAVVPSSSG